MMHYVYFTIGGFVGGFATCWFLVARLKADIAQLHHYVVNFIMTKGN
jgi:hypothetical protein